VLEFRPDVLLVVQSHRRLIGETSFQPVHLVEDIFLAQMRIYIKDFHGASTRVCLANTSYCHGPQKRAIQVVKGAVQGDSLNQRE
jgi:hypothetical protein